VSGLVRALGRVLEARATHRQVLVWYDPSGNLAALAPRAVPEGRRLLAFDGSYLALRASLEEADPRLEQTWLIYVPEPPLGPSWLRDLELAGARLELGLEALVSEAFGVATTARLRALLGGSAGRLLVARWDELLPARPSAVDLERAMVAAALELGADARLQDLAIGYVTRPNAASVLARLDLHPEFRHLLEAEGGLAGQPDGDVPAHRVAAALLLSEAVVHGRLDPGPFGDGLPAARNRPSWAAWATAWMQRSDADAFVEWSERVGRQYRIRDRLAGPDVAGVASFADVDAVLLEKATRLLEAGDRARVRVLAERRADTVWARRAESRREPLPWKAILAALDLVEGAETATADLTGRAEWSLDALFAAYGGDAGWWRIDAAYRRLESGWSRLPEPIAERLGTPAARAYGAFLDQLGAVAAAALERAASWSVAGWHAQREAAARMVGDGRRVAVVLGDALRYELGQLLCEQLRDQRIEVQPVPTVADLPSVTQVGMAAIQSPRWAEREAAVERGTFFPRWAGVPIRSRDDRLAQLRTRFPDASAIELDEVQQGRSLPRANPLLVYAGAVDEQGDSLPQIGIDLFEHLVGGIADGVDRLLRAGYQKVIVIADHGFVLTPREHEVRRVEAPGSDATTARARRYVIGRPADSEAMVRVPLDRLGWRGEGAVAFPRGLSVVALPGEVPRFFHGGPMPQETAILTLVCTRPRSAAEPVRVRLVGPEHIDTTLPRFALAGEADVLMSQSRNVRVVVRLGGRVIAESATVEIGADQLVEVGVKLERYGRAVDVTVEDVDSREVLAERSLPVVLPAGYEDLGL
jgi:hypothetical protein